MIMKNEKGITLVALIVTIVILLILTVISIRNINEDGIINRAETTTSTYSEKSAEYDLKMAITQCYSLYGNISNLGSMLDNNIWEYKEGEASTKDGQYKFRINLSNGDITRIN